jgi:uncharacterized protein with GYD domain
MPTFIMLTRVEPEALRSPRGVEVLERVAMSAVRAECPEVEWVESYALLGPYDYLDIFRAPDIETATKVATLVRIGGHAHTEVWAATEWTRYKEMVREMPDIGAVISVTG